MYPFTLLCSSANHTLQSPKMVALSFHLSLCLFCCSLSMMLLHAQTRELVKRAQFSCFHLASSPSLSPSTHSLCRDTNFTCIRNNNFSLWAIIIITLPLPRVYVCCSFAFFCLSQSESEYFILLPVAFSL